MYSKYMSVSVMHQNVLHHNSLKRTEMTNNASRVIECSHGIGAIFIMHSEPIVRKQMADECQFAASTIFSISSE